MKRIAGLVVIIMMLIMVFGADAADDGVLTLPDGLITIEEEAFRGNKSANKVIVQDGATAIGSGAFEDGRFSEIYLPSTITEIGAGAFRNCGKPTDPLRYYCIPDGINVSAEAFAGCRAQIYFNNTLLPYFQYTAGDAGITITGLTGYYPIQEAIIPDTIDGKPVIAISQNVFNGKNKLKQVTIPATVKSIGNNAFRGCSALTALQLPAGLLTIGSYAFQGSGLTSVAIPAGVKAISANTFENCQSLIQVTLQNGLENIGEKAFYDCYALSQIALPQTVTEIGVYAFAHNRALAAVTIPSGVTSLSNSVFYSCENLLSVELPAGLTAIGEYTFSNCSKLTALNLPAGLTSIGRDCFNKACRNQAGNPVYELPESLESIGSNAFTDCGAGLAVLRGGSVETMMRDLGYQFTYTDGTDLRYKYFSTNENGQTVWTLKVTGYTGSGGSVNIPAGPTVIAEKAFLNQDTVTEVIIPAGVTTIEKWAFESCDELTRAVMPDTVTTILNGAFKTDPKLTDVTFSANLTTLAGDVFTGSCRGQAGVHYYYLPDGLASFDTYTFYNCGAVLCVKRGTSAEEQILSNRYIFTYSDPDRRDFRYKKDGEKLTLWEYAGSQSPVILPDDSEAVRSAGFTNLQAGGLICSQLSDTAAALSAAGLNFTFPGHEDFRYRVIDNVLYLMSYEGTSTEVTIPEATAYIQEGVDEQIYGKAFQGKANITSVIIPDGVTRINDRAFYECTKLSNITLPGTLKSMGNSVFVRCATDPAAPQPVRLVLPDQMEDLGGRGGGDCTFLAFNAVLVCGKTSQTAALLTDRNYIYSTPGEEDFRYRYESYTEGTGANAVTGRRLWLVGYEGTGTTVNIPSGIYGITRYQNNPTSDYSRTFHAWGFYGNTGITKAVIPEGTVEIGGEAFSGCVNLTDITFPETLKVLNDGAFKECGAASQEIHYYVLPDNMTKISTNIDAGWGSFTGINNGRIACAAGSRTAILVSDAENLWQAGYSFALKGHQTDGMIYKYEYWKNEQGVLQPRLILQSYEGTGNAAVIPSGCGIYRIKQGVFKDHTELQKLVIPEGVVEIENEAFSGCTMIHLGEVKMVQGIIDGEMVSAQVIELPESLQTIGENAFKEMGSGCPNERFYLVFPDSVENFDVSAVNDCEAVFVATEGSEVGNKLYQAWYYFYPTLEDAVRRQNCIYKEYELINGEPVYHAHKGKQ